MTVQDIITDIKERYDPIAIHLSGSRARGTNRFDSDWDIHLLVHKGELPVSYVVKETSIDIKFLTFPISQEDTISTPYSPAVPFIRLWCDTVNEQVVQTLELQTHSAFNQGPKAWDKEEKQEKLLQLLRFLEAMEGTIETPAICFRHLTMFYPLVLKFWFGIHKKWSVPIYEAMVIFEKEDNRFYEQLVNIYTDTPLAHKVKASRLLYELFT